MSQARKLRRASKKRPLAEAKSSLDGAMAKLSELGNLQAVSKTLEEVPRLMDEVTKDVEVTRELVGIVIEDYNTLAFEVEMQRAVSLRLTAEVALAFDGLPRLIDRETELRAEYVVCMFLESLAI